MSCCAVIDTNVLVSALLSSKNDTATVQVLGKVITICNSENEYIDLLRKTALSIFPENTLSEFVSAFENEAFQQFQFPELITRIDSPAMIVIPIAIYA